MAKKKALKKKKVIKRKKRVSKKKTTKKAAKKTPASSLRRLELENQLQFEKIEALQGELESAKSSKNLLDIANTRLHCEIAEIRRYGNFDSSERDSMHRHIYHLRDEIDYLRRGRDRFDPRFCEPRFYRSRDCNEQSGLSIEVRRT